jgi:DMSO/TMAO reductase YedYZ molybdopterin-dependent catalytic subunit
MKKLSLGTGALVGGMITAALMGVMYLGQQLAGLPFVPYDVFNWVARELPGNLLTFGIDLMIDTLLLLGISVVDTAKAAERAMAIIGFFAGGVLAGALFFAVMKARGAKGDRFSGLVIAAVFGLPAIAISTAISQSPINPFLRILWLSALFLAWGLSLSWAYRRLQAIEEAAATAAMSAPVTADAESAAEAGEAEAAATVVAATAAEETAATVERIDRRQFLIRLGASTATITVVGAGLGAVLATAERRRQEEALAATMAHDSEASSDTPFPNSDDPVVPVAGTRPEYTPIKDFYKVFLQTEPTIIDGATWVLPIVGLVDNPLMLTIDDLRDNYEERHQYATLTCISGRVGTGLISTTRWSGCSVQDVLADAGLRPEARYLIINSGDGFFETVDLSLIENDERIMFCYGWDGNSLPEDHGYPLRIWIPDRYGMKQPKWITGIEVTDEYQDGYWVERNWSKEAIVKATSVIDTVALQATAGEGEPQQILVGGIAYAGDRGISKVEVRVDSGPWEEAQLRSPLSEATWVIWRYEMPYEPGDHTFEVRCAEGDGTPQIEEASGARPDGSSGIHSYEASL